MWEMMRVGLVGERVWRFSVFSEHMESAHLDYHFNTVHYKVFTAKESSGQDYKATAVASSMFGIVLWGIWVATAIHRSTLSDHRCAGNTLHSFLSDKTFLILLAQ